MKKIICIILVLVLLVFTCGCEDLTENISSDFVSEMQNLLTEGSDLAVSINEQKTKQDENDNTQKEKTESKKNTTNTAKEEVKKETISENEMPEIKSRLPEVKFSAKDSNVRFTDMVNLPDGGFAISGYRFTENLIYSIIQIYDKNSNLKNEYLYGDGNGFDKIAVCSDGGLIAASPYCPPCITKINSDFETEWFKPYENVEFEGTVHFL